MKSRPNIQVQNAQRRLLWPASLLTLLLMLVAATPGMADVRVSLDRDKVYTDDVFTLTIESDGQSSGQPPELAPLQKDFTVLGTSTSTQMSIFNGRRSDKTLWHVQLQPRHSGQLRIPPLRVDGQQTVAISLKVNNPPRQQMAQVGQHVFIETEVNTHGKRPYVQQQIPYTVRLYYDDRLREGELSAPEPKNAVVERLGEEKRYESVRNGRQYNVIERNYVVSPEKSGSLSIPPAVFRGRIAVPQQGRGSRRSRNPMEEFLRNSPFANDPFFSGALGADPFGSAFGGESDQPITVRSNAVKLKIKPRPATASRNWLPAEAITLTDSWAKNPPQLKVGEPVSRTITIEARGLSGSQIPELAVTAPTDTRLYPETPAQENRTDGNTIYGVRTQTLTYIPGARGTLNVPAITLNWWNTRRNKAARSTLPAWQLKVLPGVPGTASKAQAVTPAPVAKPATKTSARDALLQTGNDLLAKARKFTQAHQRELMVGGGALLILVILLTMLARRAKQRRRATASNATNADSPVVEQRPQPDRKAALRALEKACAANGRHATARALLLLGQAYWPDNPPRNLSALVARIKKGRTQIRKLDRSLYAANATDWNGAALWDEFKHGLQEKKVAGQHHDGGLKPLYPQHF